MGTRWPSTFSSAPQCGTTGPPPSAAAWTSLSYAELQGEGFLNGFFTIPVVIIVPIFLLFLFRAFIPALFVTFVTRGCLKLGLVASPALPAPTAALRRLLREAAEADDDSAAAALAALEASGLLSAYASAAKPRNRAIPDLDFVLNATRLLPFLWIVLSPDSLTYSFPTPAALIPADGFSVRSTYTSVNIWYLEHALAAGFNDEQLVILWALQYAYPNYVDAILIAELSSFVVFLLLARVAPPKVFFIAGAAMSLALYALWAWWTSTQSGMAISLWNSRFDENDATANFLNQTAVPPRWHNENGPEVIICEFANPWILRFVPLMHVLCAAHFIYALETPRAGSFDWRLCATCCKRACRRTAAPAPAETGASAAGAGRALAAAPRGRGLRRGPDADEPAAEKPHGAHAGAHAGSREIIERLSIENPLAPARTGARP